MDGERVDSRKTGGVFRKTPGADWYLPQLTRVGFVLGRPMEIVRPKLDGSRGGGGTRRRQSSRGGAARGSPAFGVSGVPGLKIERAWVGDAPHDMCDPLGFKSGGLQGM